MKKEIKPIRLDRNDPLGGRWACGWCHARLSTRCGAEIHCEKFWKKETLN